MMIKGGMNSHTVLNIRLKFAFFFSKFGNGHYFLNLYKPAL